MNIEELESWKKRITVKRNYFVRKHYELLREEVKTTNESILKDFKLNYLSKRIARMKRLYDRLIKKD